MDPRHSNIAFFEPIFKKKIGTQTRVFEKKKKGNYKRKDEDNL